MINFTNRKWWENYSYEVANTAGKLGTRKRKSPEAEFTQPRTSASLVVFSFNKVLWICLHIASIYSTTLFYAIAVLQKGPICQRPRKRKVLRINVSMPGTQNGICLQISWWMWLVFAVLPTLLKLLKKLASKSYQKPLNTETLPEYV